MYGWCKLIRENDKEMLIGYSWKGNESCDGEIRFNKETKGIEIIKLSKGVSEEETKYLISPLRNAIRRGLLQGKKCILATG